MKNVKNKKPLTIFLSILLVIAICFVISVVLTNVYNSQMHTETFAGENLFSSDNDKSDNVCVTAMPRSSTWGKIFDFNNEGITENNYQAYTYDFNVTNNTKYEVSAFKFKLVFSYDVFLASAWNGSLEIHQNVSSGEIVATVPDLREFKPDEYALNIVSVDGESFIHMKPGEYLIYTPSSTTNAMEVPIKPYEGTVPGIILYVENGHDIHDSSLIIEYTFNRLITSEPLFWISVLSFALWLVVLVVTVITTLQIKKYKDRHERDNKIISESIETFIGFIDAKDPYTNGHSKRVAEYTRLLAKELGYDGEELDRIYYVALLHDCGKIGVPDNILGKPGRLTDEEFEIIKSHTVRGGEILSSFKSLKNVGEGALYHHERYDGKGYPTGKAGEEIPLIARVICVADSFDAMNTNRVYRNKLSKERIIEEIENNKGKQFDPKIADIMLNLIKNGKISVED